MRERIHIAITKFCELLLNVLQAYFYRFRGTAAEKHCLTPLSWWWCKWWRKWYSEFPRNSNAHYLRSRTRTAQTRVASFRHCDKHRTRENCQIIFRTSSILLLLVFITLLVKCSKSPSPSQLTLEATCPNLKFPCGISLGSSAWFPLGRKPIAFRLWTGWGYTEWLTKRHTIDCTNNAF